MKLVSFRHAGKDSFGVVVEGGVVDLAPHASEVGATLKQALAKNSLAAIAAIARNAKATLAWADVEWLPVVPDPQKILCIGINYLSHVKETGREVPDKPTIFTRFADSQTAHEASIVRPAASEKLDFEGE